MRKRYMLMKIIMFFVLLLATFKSVEEAHYSKNKGYRPLAVFCAVMTGLLFWTIIAS